MTVPLVAVSNEAQLASVRAAFASQGADGTKQHQPAVSRSAAGKKWCAPGSGGFKVHRQQPTCPAEQPLTQAASGVVQCSCTPARYEYVDFVAAGGTLP